MVFQDPDAVREWALRMPPGVVHAPPGQPVTVIGPDGQPMTLRSPVPGLIQGPLPADPNSTQQVPLLPR
jgi:hypothetical protein